MCYGWWYDVQVMFVEDKNLLSILLEEIDEDQIPDIYGGKMPLDTVS